MHASARSKEGKKEFYTQDSICTGENGATQKSDKAQELQDLSWTINSSGRLSKSWRRHSQFSHSLPDCLDFKWYRIALRKNCESWGQVSLKLNLLLATAWLAVLNRNPCLHNVLYDLFVCNFMLTGSRFHDSICLKTLLKSDPFQMRDSAGLLTRSAL